MRARDLSLYRAQYGGYPAEGFIGGQGPAGCIASRDSQPRIGSITRCGVKRPEFERRRKEPSTPQILKENHT